MSFQTQGKVLWEVVGGCGCVLSMAPPISPVLSLEVIARYIEGRVESQPPPPPPTPPSPPHTLPLSLRFSTYLLTMLSRAMTSCKGISPCHCLAILSVSLYSQSSSTQLHTECVLLSRESGHMGGACIGSRSEHHEEIRQGEYMEYAVIMMSS